MRVYVAILGLAVGALLLASSARPQGNVVRVRVTPVAIKPGKPVLVRAAVRPTVKRCSGTVRRPGAAAVALARRKPVRGVVSWRWTVPNAAKGGAAVARVACAGAGVGSARFTIVTPPPPPTDPVIAAVGDIACDPSSRAFRGGNGTSRNCRQKAVSDLVANAGYSAVLVLGDIQYEDGAYWKYLQSYDRSWGRVKSITHPAIGNHEYLTPDAAGYFQYFGAAAGDPARGYYSFDLGTWHLIAINSQCNKGGRCHEGSEQETWLRQVLATHRNRCVLAYWHHPRFSSGQHGSHRQMAAIWNALVAAGADVVLAGHNHVYERFDPLGAAPASAEEPTPDPNGIRQFVVGTGGKNVTRFTRPILPGEVVRQDHTYGVLRLTLHPESYEWRFVPETGKTFNDVGFGRCS